MSEKFYVKIDRTDGSRTYVGGWVWAHCKREATAWEEGFPHYRVAIVESSPEVRQDIRRWTKATKVDVYGGQPRYFPQQEGTN